MFFCRRGNNLTTRFHFDEITWSFADFPAIREVQMFKFTCFLSTSGTSYECWFKSWSSEFISLKCKKAAEKTVFPQILFCVYFGRFIHIIWSLLIYWNKINDILFSFSICLKDKYDNYHRQANVTHLCINDSNNNLFTSKFMNCFTWLYLHAVYQQMAYVKELLFACIAMKSPA